MRSKRLTIIIKTIFISIMIGLIIPMCSYKVFANPSTITTAAPEDTTPESGSTTPTTTTPASGTTTPTTTTPASGTTTPVTTTPASTSNSDVNKTSINDIINAGNNWINGEQDNKPAGTEVNDFVDKFIGIGQALVAIGTITILIVSVIMAFKWITATPDKQAKLKTQLIGLVIAAVVIFGAVGIWNLIYGIMQNVENEIDHGNPYDKDGQTSIIVVAENKR